MYDSGYVVLKKFRRLLTQKYRIFNSNYFASVGQG